MNGLLDTHAFLWWVMEDPRLSPTSREFITNPFNQVFVSAASAWEITIKTGMGKLQINESPAYFMKRHISINNLQVLPIELSHTLETFHLPFHHRDPFDRILIAQSRVEHFSLITADPLIAQYSVEILW